MSIKTWTKCSVHKIYERRPLCRPTGRSRVITRPVCRSDQLPEGSHFRSNKSIARVPVTTCPSLTFHLGLLDRWMGEHQRSGLQETGIVCLPCLPLTRSCPALGLLGCTPRAQPSRPPLLGAGQRLGPTPSSLSPTKMGRVAQHEGQGGSWQETDGFSVPWIQERVKRNLSLETNFLKAIYVYLPLGHPEGPRARRMPMLERGEHQTWEHRPGCSGDSDRAPGSPCLGLLVEARVSGRHPQPLVEPSPRGRLS